MTLNVENYHRIHFSDSLFVGYIRSACKLLSVRQGDGSGMRGTWSRAGEACVQPRETGSEKTLLLSVTPHTRCFRGLTARESDVVMCTLSHFGLRVLGNDSYHLSDQGLPGGRKHGNRDGLEHGDALLEVMLSRDVVMPYWK